MNNTKHSKLDSLKLFLAGLGHRLESVLDRNSPTLSCGGIIRKSLADVKRAQKHCNQLLSRKSVLVLGRSFSQKAALINEIVRQRVMSDMLYHSMIHQEDVVATHYLSHDTGTCAAYCMDFHFEDIFEQLTTTRRRITADTNEILPENINQSHIIYKVQCGTRVRVRVVFENHEEVRQLLSYAEGAATAKMQEVRVTIFAFRIFFMIQLSARPTQNIHSVSVTRWN